MKNKIKSYGFWTALAGAVVVLVNALGQMFGFSVDNEIITNVIMAIAGLLVVLGVVTMPKGDNQDEKESDEKPKQENSVCEGENLNDCLLDKKELDGCKQDKNEQDNQD